MQTLLSSVFIVDDDEDDRTSIRDAFMENNRSLDYKFMHNGGQLIDHLATDTKGQQPSVILLDLNMPGMSGKDVLKEIKKNDNLRPIPVVVLTTSSSTKDKEISYKLGANCFITKPDSYPELVEVTKAIAKLWL